MHPRRVFFLIQLLFALFISAEALSETLHGPEEKRLLLQAELQLAKKTDIYFVLHLKENKIYIKARGVILRELEIRQNRFWGQGEAVKLYVLAAKKTSDEPKRDEIKPETIKKDEPVPIPSTPPEVKALELPDMPSSFKLMFDNNFVISVKPGDKMLSSISNSLSWYISQPMLTVWYAIKSRPYGALNLMLNENDARALYWSIHEGAGVLIYNPQN